MDSFTGTVKWYDSIKGYGFIVNKAGDTVFVHQCKIKSDGVQTLNAGQQVQFKQSWSDIGWQASEVFTLE